MKPDGSGQTRLAHLLIEKLGRARPERRSQFKSKTTPTSSSR